MPLQSSTAAAIAHGSPRSSSLKHFLRLPTNHANAFLNHAIFIINLPSVDVVIKVLLHTAKERAEEHLKTYVEIEEYVI